MPNQSIENHQTRPIECVSVMIIDGGSYRTNDNTALIQAMKDSETLGKTLTLDKTLDKTLGETHGEARADLIFVFLINPVYKTRTHQKHFIYDIMKTMYLDFKKNGIFLHCFCEDVVTVIKSITHSVNIKNIYMNESISYPEILNVQKLKIVSSDYDFNLKISNDVFIQPIPKESASNISYPCFVHEHINKNSPKHIFVPKPDCRDFDELCALYNDSINYDEFSFNHEINMNMIDNIDKKYNISKDIWRTFDLINKRNNIDTAERFKLLNIKASRYKAFKFLKQQKKHAESEDYYVLFPYIKYGILSVREFYHKLVDNCYNDNDLNLSNSKLMTYFVQRDYESQISRHVDSQVSGDSESQISYFTIEENAMLKDQSHVSVSDFMTAQTYIPLIDAGIRQMEIQGIMHPCVKKIVYMFARIIMINNSTNDLTNNSTNNSTNNESDITERYFQKLIDYDYVMDHDMWINGKISDMKNFKMDMGEYIRSNKLENYINEWGGGYE